MYFGTLANVLWYSRMAGFGSREIEYMQALCIYNIYIEGYSVVQPQILLKSDRSKLYRTRIRSD